MKNIPNFKAKIILTVVFAFLIFSCGSAFAKEPPEKILQSLPSAVGSFVAEKPISYGDPTLGASIGYNSSNMTTMTLYLYDLGMENIEDELRSPLVVSQRDEFLKYVEYMENEGGFRNVKCIADGETDFDIGGGKTIKMLFVSFSLDNAQVDEANIIPMVTDFYITGVKNYICKIRVTQILPSEESIKEINETIKTLLAVLSR